MCAYLCVHVCACACDDSAHTNVSIILSHSTLHRATFHACHKYVTYVAHQNTTQSEGKQTPTTLVAAGLEASARAGQSHGPYILLFLTTTLLVPNWVVTPSVPPSSTRLTVDKPSKGSHNYSRENPTQITTIEPSYTLLCVLRCLAKQAHLMPA